MVALAGSESAALCVFMPLRKVCINASNLRHGGGIQVATSFVDEMARLPLDDLAISVFVSSEVASNLQDAGIDTSVFREYRVVNCYGLSSMWSRVQKYFYGFDLVFTVFGPAYFPFMPGIWVTGFAQAWIINIDNESYKSFGFLGRLKIWLKFSLQSWFFRRSDRLVVELDHVKSGLVEKGIARKENISVVRNCVSSVYFKPDAWRQVLLRPVAGSFSIGFVGRDYIHKNISILVEVKKILLLNGFAVDFYVTLTSSEWAARSDEFRSLITNVGVLAVAECPSFYQQMDAVIFPSLLECFSATPLEAMVMKKPLFASDRGFVRDVCGDFAWYFDPVDPLSIANQIMTYIDDFSGRDGDRLMRARRHAEDFSSARRRAEDYLSIIRDALNFRAD